MTSSEDSAVYDVLERINAAAHRAGRDPNRITLVAVSKLHPVERMLQFETSVAQCGRTAVFGESYVQECKAKRPFLSKNSQIHFIGTLQRNKADVVVNVCDLIQSVHSMAVLAALAKAARKQGKVLPLLLQVNISGDAAKSGFTPAELDAAIEQCFSCCDCLTLKGLMTITRLYERPADVRADFRAMRAVADSARRLARATEDSWELSMGMSSDFEIAIEEGATIVRVGTAIFGERPPY